MPQFDISTFAPQIFWLITSFLFLWLVMDRFIVPKIRDSIEERKRKYDEIILKAEQFNQKAKKSLAKYEDKIAAAKINMSEQIKAHEEELRKIIKEKELEIDIKLKDKIKTSEESLKEDQEETLSRIEEISEKVAITIVNHLELTNITIDDIKNASKKGDTNE
jgi:F-type H+-transporting ATPase subunit b